MAASATSVVFLEAAVREPASYYVHVSEVASGMKENDEKQEMCRRLFERFMASCGPRGMYRCEVPIPKVRSRPCVTYTMRVSIQKAQASWSCRTSRRFFPERQGHFPLPIYRVSGPDGQVEQVVDRSGAPGEPCRPGTVSCFSDPRYCFIERSRKKGVFQKEGSSAPWREVAVLRPMPGGCGITVTSHVKHLVVRLRDILFFLFTSVTVNLHFSEKWFRLPSGWTEERLYAEDGFHIIDIASSVENLVRKLCNLCRLEESEMKIQKLETEEERERRLQEEEVRRLQEEEKRRKIREQNEEERRRIRAEAAAMPRPRAPSIWDATLWLINEAHPASARCYSKFKLSMNSNKTVSCECVDKESLGEMLRRVENSDFLLPISKTALASSRELETLGSVEGYIDLENFGLGAKGDLCIDRSGRMDSSVLMVSRSVAKALTIVALVRNLDIVMDDGMIMSCCRNVSVDIHCDDISSSELLKKDWAYHVFCKNIDGEGRTSFSTLLVHLKKKLQLQLTKEELGLYNMSAIDGEVDDEDRIERRRKVKEWIPPKPKHELAEVDLHDCTLFQTYLES